MIARALRVSVVPLPAPGRMRRERTTDGKCIACGLEPAIHICPNDYHALRGYAVIVSVGNIILIAAVIAELLSR